MAYPLSPSWRIAREIGLGIHELGLVAVAIGGQLFDLGLIGPRIDLREQIAGLDGLSFGEGDLDELSLDLAAHDVGVVGDHRADAAQVDRNVLSVDGRSDHRDGDVRHRNGRRGGPQLPEIPEAAARQRDDDNYDQCDDDASFHGPVSSAKHGLRDCRGKSSDLRCSTDLDWSQALPG